jgi:hypothetical protein
MRFFLPGRWPLGLCLLLVATPLCAQKPIGELVAEGASVRGMVSLEGGGTRILSGSQITAGEAAARLHLVRGGELRVCPKTNLSANTDSEGKTMVFGLNIGALEVDYPLGGGSDSLLTPDFRVQLIGPGNFHFAISVTPAGDTCLRPLPGNDASLFLSEMMGNDSYQLTPGKSILFKGGRISGAAVAPSSCGCPAGPATPPKPAPELVLPTAVPELSPLPATAPQAHLEADTAFAYRAKDEVQDVTVTVAKLSVSRDDSHLTLAMLPRVTPPAKAAAPPKPEKKPGLWQRFSGMVNRLFGK